METFEMAQRYFAGRVKNKADVEDLLQIFYLKLYRSLTNYNDNGNFYAFFYKLARNVYLDWLREQNIRAVADEVDFQRLPTDGDFFKQIEDRIDIEQALQKLEEIDREILKLYFVDNLKNQEIAEILDLTEENIKVRKHRALKKLREILKDYG
jgi:RNA polymerase sigma-70 factor (ECF subfamily)